MNKTLETFLEIVQIDSPSGEEAKMREYLKKRLEKMGWKTRVDKVGNMLVKNPKKEVPKLLLCAHMDTVSPGKSIKPKVVGGIVRSDGMTVLGADNKAAVSAIVVAVEEYQEKWGKLPEVEMLLSVREETGGGVEFFPFEWLKAKEGVTLDFASSLGGIVLAAPYIYNFRIKYIGKPAHASRPEKGRNALVAMGQFLGQMKVGAYDNHETTINIGVVKSGVGINTIPGEAVIEGEVRSTIREKFETHLKKVEKLARECAKENKVRIEFVLDGYCPGYSYTKNDELVRKMAKVVKGQGLKPIYERTTGVSDVNSLVGAGMRAVCLADGVKNPHTKEEGVEVKTLDDLKNLVAALLEI